MLYFACMKKMSDYSLLFLILGFSLWSCAPKIYQKPIVWDAERKALSLEYLKNRYGIIKTEPTIVPRMVVVHWTAIPTFEKSFTAFYPAKLPNYRPEIATASALNVGVQYLVDRDGSIHQMLPDTAFARHVIGLNHCAIGIENVGNGDTAPLTTAQLKANIKLIKHLMKKYPIEHVIGHHEYTEFTNHALWKEIDPDYRTVKDDPGAEFMEGIRKRLKGLNY